MKAQLDAPKWALISLEDGMIAQRSLTREQMSTHLNEAGEIPAELI